MFFSNGGHKDGWPAGWWLPAGRLAGWLASCRLASCWLAQKQGAETIHTPAAIYKRIGVDIYCKELLLDLFVQHKKTQFKNNMGDSLLGVGVSCIIRNK